MNTPFFTELNEKLLYVRGTLAKINLNRHGPVPEESCVASPEPDCLESLCRTTGNLLTDIEREVSRLFESHALGQEVASRGHP